MKVGTIVRDKETDKLGHVCGLCSAMNWFWVYWVEESKREKVVNYSLTVIYGGD